MRKIKTSLKASSTSAKAAKAAPVAPVKAAPVIAKPAKPASGNADAKRAERSKLIGEAREHTAQFYSGASLTVHAKAPPKLQAVLDRVANPVQKPGNGPTTRDEAQLATALKYADPKTLAFDPVARGFDLGVISRNAASGFYCLTPDKRGVMLTKSGAERARLVSKA